jgi:hypothetical protein
MVAAVAGVCALILLAEWWETLRDWLRRRRDPWR